MPASSRASWAAHWAGVSPSTGQPLGTIQRLVLRVVMSRISIAPFDLRHGRTAYWTFTRGALLLTVLHSSRGQLVLGKRSSPSSTLITQTITIRCHRG